jgi:hypothetical protein
MRRSDAVFDIRQFGRFLVVQSNRMVRITPTRCRRGASTPSLVTRHSPTRKSSCISTLASVATAAVRTPFATSETAPLNRRVGWTPIIPIRVAVRAQLIRCMIVEATIRRGQRVFLRHINREGPHHLTLCRGSPGRVRPSRRACRLAPTPQTEQSEPRREERQTPRFGHRGARSAGEKHTRRGCVTHVRWQGQRNGAGVA